MQIFVAHTGFCKLFLFTLNISTGKLYHHLSVDKKTRYDWFEHELSVGYISHSTSI
jgi:hypothetical protein